MRHNVLCLIVAFLAAVVCFVLVPIIGFLLLRTLLPGLFEDDTLTWVLIFAGPALLAVLLSLSLTAGGVAFFLAKARLPDRGWLSAPSLAVLLIFMGFNAAGAAAAYLYIWEPPEIGPQQTGLPELHLARTLATKDRLSSVWQLAWSADGERLASYDGTGVITWSPDGRFQKKFPLHENYSSGAVLRFLTGHRLLITSPLTEVDGGEDRRKLDDVAFSLIDAETGKVLQHIPGPYPGGRGPDNQATDLVVSPDERWVAAICGSAKPQINIFSTGDWKRVAVIGVETSGKENAFHPQGLVFSPDSKELAVIYDLHGRINFFEVGSWTLSGTLLTFSDQPRGIVLDTIAFSPNREFIAVGSFGGGSWWVDQRNSPTRPGWGTLRQEFPPDPLRVYRVSDGTLLSSLGSFPGGLSRDGLIWSPSGEYLAFHDALGDIRLWTPFRPDLSVRVAREGDRSGSLQFSKDGSQLAATFPDGVRVFNVVATK